MAFAVPGHELDFAIYGDANTNKLQLMPVQVHQLQAQQQQIPARLKGPDLTGYQSGIFDDRSGTFWQKTFLSYIISLLFVQHNRKH